MDDGARLWLAKAARKNYWRVSRWYDLDDLIQEGYCAYYDSVRRYPDATDPPHRMALFKRVFMSRLIDMANKRTRDIEEMCMADLRTDDDSGAPNDVANFPAEPGLEDVLASLANAPSYVKDALALFAGADISRLRSSYRQVKSGRWLRRETLNERLCRLTGYDPTEVDIVGGIKACLAGEKKG